MAAVKGPAERRADEGHGLLVELGLTLNEARAYAALLKLGIATAAEVARTAGVPRQKVYATLRALEERGFLRSTADGVTTHTPVPPPEALGAWLRRREHERLVEAEHDELLAERLRQVLPRPRRGGVSHPPDELEAVAGRARTTETLERIIGATERTLSMMQQPPFLQPRARWNEVEAAVAARGAVVKVLYSREAARDERRWRTLAEAGGETREVETVPMKLLVRDGVEAFISLRDPVTGDQGLTSAIIRHPDLVRPLQLLFEREWRRGRRLAPPRRPR